MWVPGIQILFLRFVWQVFYLLIHLPRYPEQREWKWNTKRLMMCSGCRRMGCMGEGGCEYWWVWRWWYGECLVPQRVTAWMCCFYIKTRNPEWRLREMMPSIPTIEFKVDVGYHTDFKQAVVSMSVHLKPKIGSQRSYCRRKENLSRKVLTAGKNEGRFAWWIMSPVSMGTFCL